MPRAVHTPWDGLHEGWQNLVQMIVAGGPSNGVAPQPGRPRERRERRRAAADFDGLAGVFLAAFVEALDVDCFIHLDLLDSCWS